MSLTPAQLKCRDELVAHGLPHRETCYRCGKGPCALKAELEAAAALERQAPAEAPAQ